MNGQDFWRLFHLEWGKAHEAPGYEKAHWRTMQGYLESTLLAYQKAFNSPEGDAVERERAGSLDGIKS